MTQLGEGGDSKKFPYMNDTTFDSWQQEINNCKVSNWTGDSGIEGKKTLGVCV